MAQIYKKLRKMGHGVRHSLWQSFAYNYLPLGPHNLVEFDIERELSTLEELADRVSGLKYQPESKTNPKVQKTHIDRLVSYLDGQIKYGQKFEDNRISPTQKQRYDVVLEKLAKAYPIK